MKIQFSDTELDQLRHKVAEAEKGTTGEIVVFVTPRSDSYEAALWRGASLGLIAVMGVWTLIVVVSPYWNLGALWSPALWITLGVAGALGGAALTKFSGTVLRRVAGRSRIERAVTEKAQRTFLSEGVMETAQRTGILLFVSLLERRIEILADKGINAVVDDGRWAEIVSLVVDRLRGGDGVGALSAGISACGNLLLESGFHSDEDDQNELGDDIRYEAD